MRSHRIVNGFTLIELSIVLVIIGLIVGGVLVGRDLIQSAAIRAQISQVEKYNASVNTFRTKYNGLPGDLLASQVTTFGFSVAPVRAGTNCQGDGDGLIKGYNFTGAGCFLADHTGGESEWFWEDLSANSGMIDGYFNTGNTTQNAPSNQDQSGSLINRFLPPAKIGLGNYLSINTMNGFNYFTLSAITWFGGSNGDTTGLPGLSVIQAYNIDKKIDDGLPQTGNAIAKHANNTIDYNNLSWSAGGGVAGVAPGNVATASASSCYDNGGSASAPMQYSTGQNSGTGINCALSFKFQ